MKFEDLGLKEELLKAVNDLGFENAMPVQEQTIPTIMYNDVNLIALAQTGTGKTAAFGLPVLNRLDMDSDRLEALFICPTRELCIQIANDCQKYAKYMDKCNIVPVYGGASIEVQIRELKKKAKILVATPGRLIDLMTRKKVSLSDVKYLVLDEADEMLNMGFKDDLDTILASTPEEKNTYLFSATMPAEVEEIAKNYIINPVRIQIGQRNQGSENVKHYYYMVHQKDRYLALKRIADYYPDIYAIVFCRTKVETQEVADMLIKDGYNADALHGDLSQAQRDHVMSRFRLRNIQMLVATDVAARGLDVSNLTHVINYELPDELEQYVHRSGRTGRADKQGISIAIINMKEKGKIRKIEQMVKKEFEKAKIPTGKDVCKKQLFNLINRVELADIDSEEIDTFLPEISKKLSYMDREELIKHFIALEFNQLLKYYKDAPDLNIDEAVEKEKQKREKKAQQTKRNYDKSAFLRLFINVGHRDRIVPQRIIGMINEYTPSRRIEIGRIDILDNFSYIEVDNEGAMDVVDALNGRQVRGREIRVELADEKQDSKEIKKQRRTERSEKKKEFYRERESFTKNTASNRKDDGRKDRKNHRKR